MQNKTKEKLRNGEVTVGAVVSTPSLEIVEVMARMNFDWLWFDTEHSPLNSEILAPMLQVARMGAPTPIVRVVWNDPVVIKKALDVGAMGLIIPWVNNRAQAEAAVRAAKYPPMGIRGFGPRWVTIAGQDIADYARTANDETLVIVQIETAEAVKNLEEILTTPGVDAFLIGPQDLAASLGHLNNPAHPEVEQVIVDVITRRKKLKVPGCYATASPELCLKRIEQGFQFVTVGGDLGLLRIGAQTVMEKMGRKI
jgi:2-keto-3-deoxy-L-rhamnonate aldolase RhmA